MDLLSMDLLSMDLGNGLNGFTPTQFARPRAGGRRMAGSGFAVMLPDSTKGDENRRWRGRRDGFALAWLVTLLT